MTRRVHPAARVTLQFSLDSGVGYRRAGCPQAINPPARNFAAYFPIPDHIETNPPTRQSSRCAHVRHLPLPRSRTWPTPAGAEDFQVAARPRLELRAARIPPVRIRADPDRLAAKGITLDDAVPRSAQRTWTRPMVPRRQAAACTRSRQHQLLTSAEYKPPHRPRYLNCAPSGCPKSRTSRRQRNAVSGVDDRSAGCDP